MLERMTLCCRWEYDGTEEEAVKSIPYQLQRLFLQLQVGIVLSWMKYLHVKPDTVLAN